MRFFWLLLAVLASGCATNTITGRSQLMMVSEQSAISGSASAYSRMVGGLAQKGKIEKDTPRALRVKEITDRLIAQAVRFRPDAASWKWEVQVIQEPKTVNAFCMAGGKMAIYTGFWDKLKATDEEIAAVMGHEIGHALASHTREKMSVGLSTQLGALAVAALLSRNDPGGFARNADAMSGAAALAVTLPNSREAENEADQIGIELAARAGFDPRAAVSLWQKMHKSDGSGVPEFISTHPSHETRIQNLSALVSKVDPLYQMAKAGKAPTEPDTMTFVAASFEKFKRGEVVFDCGVPCAFSYARHKGDWKEMQGKKAWRDLAVSVMNVGYLDGESYTLLAEAAAGLGLPDAARTYRERAAALKKK